MNAIGRHCIRPAEKLAEYFVDEACNARATCALIGVPNLEGEASEIAIE